MQRIAECMREWYAMGLGTMRQSDLLHHVFEIGGFVRRNCIAHAEALWQRGMFEVQAVFDDRDLNCRISFYRQVHQKAGDVLR